MHSSFYFRRSRVSILEPLNRILDRSSKWVWSRTNAYMPDDDETEALLKSDYDHPLALACAASLHSVHAILCQDSEADDGNDQVAFASKTLTPVESEYSEQERETYALVFGVTRFHKQVEGRFFNLFTSYKPLVDLLAKAKDVPQTVTAQMLLWVGTLEKYDFELHHREGSDDGESDGSCSVTYLPLPSPSLRVADPHEVRCLEEVDVSMFSAVVIAKHSACDPVLERVLTWLACGWPDDCVQLQSFHPFIHIMEELSVYKGCLLWKRRVVIPAMLRTDFLHMLHVSQPGYLNMCALAKSYIWWPELHADIKRVVNKCRRCQECPRAPARAPLFIWEWKQKPWEQLEFDFFAHSIRRTRSN